MQTSTSELNLDTPTTSKRKSLSFRWFLRIIIAVFAALWAAALYSHISARNAQAPVVAPAHDALLEQSRQDAALVQQAALNAGMSLDIRAPEVISFNDLVTGILGSHAIVATAPFVTLSPDTAAKLIRDNAQRPEKYQLRVHLMRGQGVGYYRVYCPAMVTSKS